MFLFCANSNEFTNCLRSMTKIQIRFSYKLDAVVAASQSILAAAFLHFVKIYPGLG
jgi:hypothetical protein